jgi:DNA polymerase III subunit gamma/tau
MAYQVLARKYRPQQFADVIGQEHVTTTLLNALAQNRVAHGYIFSGHRGIGKTTVARILAMALNCRTAVGDAKRPTAEPCGVCESCTEVRAGNSVDVIEIDAATNRGIDEIRELRDAARYRPARDKYKIYILDEAHQITEAAFNALLKTLEEPPDHVIFMMATTQPEDIPQTIRSRCQHFSFHAVSFDAIVAQLDAIAKEENISASPEIMGMIAEAGDGSMRDALSIMDQAIASAPTDKKGHAVLSLEQARELLGSVPATVFERMLELVSANNSAALLTESDTLLNAGHNPQQLARQLVRYLRNALMAKIAGEKSELLQISEDARARAARSAMLFGEEELTRFLNIMLRTFDDLGYRQEQRFHFELGLLKLVHAQRLLPLEQILSQSAGAVAAGRPAAATAARPQAAAAAPAAGRASAPAPAAAPTYSPFESDSRRKSGGVETSSTTSASISALTNVAPASATSVAPATSAVPKMAAAAEPARESAAPASAGSLALDTATQAEDKPDAAREMDPQALQQAGVTMLANAGEATAAHTLAESDFALDGQSLTIAVPLVAKMMDLTLPVALRKKAESAMRQFESNLRVQWKATGAEQTRKPQTKVSTAATGDAAKQALAHPLVQRAKELFNAEVRSVVDLRDRQK